jgi:hypothetical protein
MQLAAGAQAAVLRIEALLPPHIAEESDKKMDELEARMAVQERELERDLKELAPLVPAGDRARLKEAETGYARFAELKKEILKLSRENTNVRSLSISLNEKRKVTQLSQEALAELEQAIAAEPIRGSTAKQINPR